MTNTFDGELPPDVISKYPAEEVEELGIIDLGRGVLPTHIRTHHYRLRRLARNGLGLLTVLIVLVVIWWIFKPAFYCLLARVGLIVTLIFLDAYVAQWRLNQEQHEQSLRDDFWWNN